MEQPLLKPKNTGRVPQTGALVAIAVCALCCVVEFCFVGSPDPVRGSWGFMRPYQNLLFTLAICSPLISLCAYLLVFSRVSNWYRLLLGLLVIIPFLFVLFFVWWASGWD
jgi:hypothetical protein